MTTMAFVREKKEEQDHSLKRTAMVKKRSYSEMTTMASSSSPTVVTSKDQEKHIYIVLSNFLDSKYSCSLHKINLTDLSLRFDTSMKKKHMKKKKKALVLPKPILKLPSKQFCGFTGFLAFQSRIYMFGADGGLDCYVFETSSPQNPNSEALLLKRTPNMCGGKKRPIVLGPVHGKFYVISYTLAYRDLDEFNPETECWTRLPRPLLGQELRRDEYDEDYRKPHRDDIEKLDYFIERHCTVGNKLMFLTPFKGIYVYDVLDGSWDVLFCFGHDVFHPHSIYFDFFSYVRHQGLRFVQVYANEKKSGSAVYNALRGCDDLERGLVSRTDNHHVLVVEESSELCVVSGRHSSDNKFYVSVDLCSLAAMGGPNVDDVVPVRKHRYATYEGCNKMFEVQACFVI